MGPGRGLAVVASGVGEVAVREMAVPDPGPEDVAIAVRHSWIGTGTERSFILGERIAGDPAWRQGVATVREDRLPAARRAVPGGLQVTVGRVDLVHAPRGVLPHEGHIVSLGFSRRARPHRIHRLGGRGTTRPRPSDRIHPRMDATLAAIADGRQRTEERLPHREAVREAPEAHDRLIRRHPDVLGVVPGWCSAAAGGGGARVAR